VRDLGIFIDADLSMRSHVQRTVAGCFAVLRQLRSVRRSAPSSVFQTLIVTCADETRLWQRYVGWFTDLLTESPPDLFSTLQLGRSPVYDAQITSLTLLPVFTGFVLLSVSISNWRSLYTELCTALHLDTCLAFFAALLTCRLVVVYGRRLLANLTSARRVS